MTIQWYAMTIQWDPSPTQLPRRAKQPSYGKSAETMFSLACKGEYSHPLVSQPEQTVARTTEAKPPLSAERSMEGFTPFRH